MNENFCTLPWRSLSIDPDGSVRPCCIYEGRITNEYKNPFYVQNSSLAEIQESEYMQKLRQKFRAGERPKECRVCWDDESKGYTSKRMRNVSRATDSVKLEHCNMILSSSCNLKCRTCGPSHSTLWAQEVLQQKGDRGYPIPFGQPGHPEGKLWKDRSKWMTEINEIEVVGGEPFFTPLWKQLWSEMIANGRSRDVKLQVCSNMTLFDEELISRLASNFRYFGLGLSIDGMGPIYEYLRHPAKWDTVRKNLESLRKLRQKLSHDGVLFDVSFVHTVSWLNAWYASDFHEFVTNEFPQFDLWFNIVHTPEPYALSQMPMRLKDEVAKKWGQYAWGAHAGEIEALRSTFERGNPIEDLSAIYEIDKVRGESFSETFDEIWPFLDSYSETS